MNCNVTNPISSNSVIEVGLYKPACATFSGNSLNDWLKWLAEKQCEIDYATFDLSCITSEEVCNQGEREVIQKILDALCILIQTKESIYTESIIDITPNEGWTDTRTFKAYKRGKLITLLGLATGGNVGNAICTLPSGYKPSADLTFCVAHAFEPSTDYNVFLQVKTTGDIILYFTGTTPPEGTSENVFLDGISFFIY